MNASTPATQTTTKDLSFCSGPLLLFPRVAGKSARRVMAGKTDGISRWSASNAYVSASIALPLARAWNTQPDATRNWSGEIDGTHTLWLLLIMVMLMRGLLRSRATPPTGLSLTARDRCRIVSLSGVIVADEMRLCTALLRCRGLSLGLIAERCREYER